MQNHSDAQLLRQYAAQHSEAAFSEIVARHAGLVYSAALRQLDSSGVPHPRETVLDGGMIVG